MRHLKSVWLCGLGILLAQCGGGGGEGGAALCSAVASAPAGVTSAPPMTYYVGSSTDETGTALASLLDIVRDITPLGCGPFGIWDFAHDRVASSVTMRLATRHGVFSMTDGVVAAIEQTSTPAETGEVAGVYVRYGESFVVKYAHVTNVRVTLGDPITAGQKLGDTAQITSGVYLSEIEFLHKDGEIIYAVPINSYYLSNLGIFNSLYGAGNCTPGAAFDTDGETPTFAAAWVNAQLMPPQWDVTSRTPSCIFLD